MYHFYLLIINAMGPYTALNYVQKLNLLYFLSENNILSRKRILQQR
jgi:hypothetical protein